ncbi:phage terminase large subunit [Zunongwangia atlantica]|uniref:Terminase large subunit gp17-like C-terminal domain-containing protein n=1 Tax=Zunongwangia atlantica 22II14-10F7 TaxID=1185767 RepID=A0A1Y1T2X5_9FLAO|nr:phage terminase large subunit [Zunongwangia atlantica]ORL45389.1 hypothetical protein IIF7_11223 [Zunongwangia atlantica 22II14-10F7]
MDVKLYTPHAKQLEVHHSCDDLSYLFTVVCAGRQTGKSTLAQNQAIKWALEHDDVVIMWVTPFQSQANKAYKEILKLLTNAPFVASHKAAQGDTEIIFTNGTVIKFRSAGAENALRGETVHFLVMDEAAFIKKTTFDEVIFPMLSTSGQKVLIISTPKGKNNWFYEKFLDGKKTKETSTKSFHFNYMDNPHTSKFVVATAKASLTPTAFGQEYLAEFVDGAAVIENIEECCSGRMQLLPKEGEIYFAGIDLALKNDYTVFSVVDSTGNLVYFDRFNQVTAPQLKERLVTNLNAWKPQNTLIEVNNMGQVIYDDLKSIYKVKNIQPWLTSHTSKNNIITKLINAFSSKDIICPNDQNLKEELDVFTMIVTPSGKATYKATEGFHDDIVMSLAIAREAQTHAGNNQFNLKFVNY